MEKLTLKEQIQILINAQKIILNEIKKASDKEVIALLKTSVGLLDTISKFQQQLMKEANQ